MFAGHLMHPCPQAHAPNAVFHQASNAEKYVLVPETEPNPNCHQGIDWATAGWLKKNPLGVATHRELASIAYGRSVYRILLRKE